VVTTWAARGRQTARKLRAAKKAFITGLL